MSDLAPKFLFEQTCIIESNSVYLRIYDRCLEFVASSNAYRPKLSV